MPLHRLTREDGLTPVWSSGPHLSRGRGGRPEPGRTREHREGVEWVGPARLPNAGIFNPGILAKNSLPFVGRDVKMQTRSQSRLNTLSDQWGAVRSRPWWQSRR